MTPIRLQLAAASRALLALLLLALPEGIVSPALGAPITFNTALPVSRGQGIFRLQLKSIRSSDDPSSLDRDLSVLAMPLVVVYGATEDLALFAITPILDKELELATPAGRRTRSVSGVGDVTLLARYTAVQRDQRGATFRVAPFAGIELPTGRDDERDGLGRLPQPLQLGSGSWDVLVGGILTRQTLAWQLDLSASAKRSGRANDFRFGDTTGLDLSYQRRLSPRELGPGSSHFLYGVLESNLAWLGRNQLAGIDDPSSGGFTWMLAPGVQYVTKRLVLEAAIQIPVVQDLNGAALENDYTATLSTRVNF